MTSPTGKFTAVLLAGDRGHDDPVASGAGVGCKALVPINGRPMVLRVIDALAGSSLVDSILLCGSSERLRGHSAELDELLATGRIGWLENRSTPSLSAGAALDVIPADRPALVTTADHALLTSGLVDNFLSQAVTAGCDVVAGVASADMVRRAFPESRRTVTRLRGGGYCGCNLFAFLTPRARNAVQFWRRVESHRKHPLKIAGVLGYGAVLRYLLGLLTLAEGLARMSELMDARAGVVWMPDPEAAVDVDTIEDLILVEKYLAGVQR